MAAFNKKPSTVTGGKTIINENPIISKIFGLSTSIKPEKGPDLIGHPGSPGQVEGIAKVIVDINQLHEVQERCILVVPSLNPAWTAIVPLINGLVTDFGGTLSHAAIVCREYGIPAVVGTLNATKLIKDGQIIKLDGNRGYVWFQKR